MIKRYLLFPFLFQAQSRASSILVPRGLLRSEPFPRPQLLSNFPLIFPRILELQPLDRFYSSSSSSIALLRTSLLLSLLRLQTQLTRQIFSSENVFLPRTNEELFFQRETIRRESIDFFEQGGDSNSFVQFESVRRR